MFTKMGEVYITVDSVILTSCLILLLNSVMASDFDLEGRSPNRVINMVQDNVDKTILRSKEPNKNVLNPYQDDKVIRPNPVKQTILTRQDSTGIEQDLKVAIATCGSIGKHYCKIVFYGANVLYIQKDEVDANTKLYQTHESSVSCGENVFYNNLVEAGFFPSSPRLTGKVYYYYTTKDIIDWAKQTVGSDIRYKSSHLEDCRIDIYELEVISPFTCKISISKEYPPRVTLTVQDGSIATVNNKPGAAYEITYGKNRLMGSVKKGSFEIISLTGLLNGDRLDIYCGLNEIHTLIAYDEVELCRTILSKFYMHNQADYICENLNTAKTMIFLSIALLIIWLFKFFFGSIFTWIGMHIRSAIVVAISLVIHIKHCNVCAYPYFYFHMFHSFHCHDCGRSFVTPEERKNHIKFGHYESLYVNSLTNHTFYAGFRVINVVLKGALLFLLVSSLRQVLADDVSVDEWIRMHNKGTMMSADPLTQPNVITVQTERTSGDLKYALTSVQMRLNAGNVYEGLLPKSKDINQKIPDLQIKIKASKIRAVYTNYYTTCRILTNGYLNTQTVNHGGCKRCLEDFMQTIKAPDHSVRQCYAPDKNGNIFMGDSQNALCTDCTSTLDMNDCYTVYRYVKQEPSYTVQITSYPFTYKKTIDNRDYYKEQLISFRPYFEETTLPNLIALNGGKIYKGNICDLGQYDCFGSFKVGSNVDYQEVQNMPIYVSGQSIYLDENLSGKKARCFSDTYYLKDSLTLLEGYDFNPNTNVLHTNDINLGNIDINLPVLTTEKVLTQKDVSLNAITCMGCYNCIAGAYVKATFESEKDVISVISCEGYQTLGKKLISADKTKTVRLSFSSNIPNPNFTCNSKEVQCELAQETIDVVNLRKDYINTQLSELPGISSEDLSIQDMLDTLKKTYYWFKNKVGYIIAFFVTLALFLLFILLMNSGLLTLIFDIFKYLFSYIFRHKVNHLSDKFNNLKKTKINYRPIVELDEEAVYPTAELQRMLPPSAPDYPVGQTGVIYRRDGKVRVT